MRQLKIVKKMNVFRNSRGIAAGDAKAGKAAGVSAEGLGEALFMGWECKEGRVQLESTKIKTNGDQI